MAGWWLAYLECLVGLAESLFIEVGHSHSISQAYLLAVRQATHKGSVGEEVGEGCREMDLIKRQLGNLKPPQASLHAAAIYIWRSRTNDPWFCKSVIVNKL